MALNVSVNSKKSRKSSHLESSNEDRNIPALVEREIVENENLLDINDQGIKESQQPNPDWDDRTEDDIDPNSQAFQTAQFGGFSQSQSRSEERKTEASMSAKQSKSNRKRNINFEDTIIDEEGETEKQGDSSRIEDKNRSQRKEAVENILENETFHPSAPEDERPLKPMRAKN